MTTERDLWERYKAGGSALMANLQPNRATPARAYQVRLYLDSVHGPIWLELLAAMGWGLGVVTEGAYQVDTTWASRQAGMAHSPTVAERRARRAQQPRPEAADDDAEDSLWE